MKTPNAPIKVMHIITDLGMGGAEMALYRLIGALDRETFTCEVISLTDDQPIGNKIRNLGISVTALNLRPGMPDPRLVTRLVSHIRRSRPDLIQTWMYHADLTGGLAAQFAGTLPVVWGIHHAAAELRDLKQTTRWIVRTNALLSHFLPVAVVYCAESSRRAHVRYGYQSRQTAIIPNGVDLNAFRPNPQVRHEVRRELGIRENTPLIGLCARFHPDKDHHNFVRAAAILHEQMPEVEFLLWGEAMDARNSVFAAWMGMDSLREKLHLLGQRTDPQRLNAALDIATLSSANEAFPLVVVEAMACEVSCAVTNVGDAAYIVGDTGRVVPRRNPQALAEAWRTLLELSPQERATLGKQARQRVVAHFDLKQTAAAYAQLYRDIITGLSK